MRRVRFALFGFLPALLIGAGVGLYTPDKPRADLEAAYAGAPSRFVEVAGTRLHLRDTGPREPDERRDVVDVREPAARRRRDHEGGRLAGHRTPSPGLAAGAAARPLSAGYGGRPSAGRYLSRRPRVCRPSAATRASAPSS